MKIHRLSKSRIVALCLLTAAGAIWFFESSRHGIAETNPSSQPVVAAKADRKEASEQLEMDVRRFRDLKDRYDNEYRTALAEMKAWNDQLADMGGLALGQDGSATAIELRQWVLKKADLEFQQMALDAELDQFKTIRAAGHEPPSINKSARLDSNVSREEKSLEAAKEAALAPNDANTAALKLAEKAFDDALADSTKKAMSEYESDLNWRRQNCAQLLDGVATKVKDLSVRNIENQKTQYVLVRRTEDLAVYRGFIERYENKLDEVEKEFRDLQKSK